MAIFKAVRVVRKCGRAFYLALPRLARLELRVFAGDWVDMELDTDRRTLTLRPLHVRSEVPLIEFVTGPDMVPSDAPSVPPPPGVRVPDGQPTLVEIDQ